MTNVRPYKVQAGTSPCPHLLRRLLSNLSEAKVVVPSKDVRRNWLLGSRIESIEYGSSVGSLVPARRMIGG
jgi:hypothetical protein